MNDEIDYPSGMRRYLDREEESYKEGGVLSAENGKQYQVKRKLRETASSDVFLVEKDNHQVVLKLYKFAKTSQAEINYGKEVSTMMSLDHENIIPVLDSSVINTRVSVEMPYVRGGSASEMMISGAHFEPDQVVDIIEGISSAVDYVNAQGILHRDIKPSNVLLSEEPEGRYKPYLTDFGICSKVIELTPGLITGSTGYMSPEQILGTIKAGDSEQYAVAILAYELLTGDKMGTGFIDRPRLRGLSNIEKNRMVDTMVDQGFINMDGVPDHVREILELNPETAKLIPVFDKAWKKDPNERYQSSTAFAAALKESLGKD